MPESNRFFSSPVRTSFRRIAASFALLATVLLAGGCADAPTFPATLRWLAEGEEWIAVLPPSSLPTAAEWARSTGDPAGREALALRMNSMEAQAAAALSRGDLAGATRLRSDATVLLSRSVRHAPDRGILQEGASAVDLWTTRVHADLGAEDAPALASALDSIAAARRDASRALAAGDSVGAARALIDAGERIRTWSPTFVAARLLGRVEARVAARAATGTDGLRAQHLLRSSREALGSGDPVRAMQRAIYALQLAGGQQMSEPPLQR
jgi:hypothetical protein